MHLNVRSSCFVISGPGAEEEGICKVLEAIQHDPEGFLQGECVSICLYVIPNTTISDLSHVNICNGCLMLHHSFNLNWLVSYNGRLQMVAGLRRIFYWVQLFIILFLLTRTCKKDVTTHC